MTRRHLPFRALCCFVLLLAAAPLGAGDLHRYPYLGSANISLPTGYTLTEGGYLNDDSRSSAFFSQRVMGKFIEFSMLRPMSGQDAGDNLLNLKVNFLEEDKILPSICWGVADLQEQRSTKVFFFAGSKMIESFGLTIHGGFYKDPVTTRHQNFLGFEKTILPLIAVVGERVQDTNTFGVKLRPYPNVSVEYDRRLLDSDEHQQIFKLTYFKTF